MSLFLHFLAEHTGGFPRTRGDEPGYFWLVLESDAFSPHTRG